MGKHFSITQLKGANLQVTIGMLKHGIGNKEELEKEKERLVRELKVTLL